MIPLFLHITKNVYRKDTVSIFICIYRVVSAMSCLIGLFCQIHNTGDVILAMSEALELLDVIRFPFGTIPPDVTKSDLSIARSLTAGFGSTLSKSGIGILCYKRFVCQFLRSISNRSLRSSFFLEEVYTNTIWHISFFSQEAPIGLPLPIFTAKGAIFFTASLMPAALFFVETMYTLFLNISAPGFSTYIPVTAGIPSSS